jgi:hypothetical protein
MTCKFDAVFDLICNRHHGFNCTHSGDNVRQTNSKPKPHASNLNLTELLWHNSLSNVTEIGCEALCQMISLRKAMFAFQVDTTLSSEPTELTTCFSTAKVAARSDDK